MPLLNTSLEFFATWPLMRSMNTRAWLCVSKPSTSLLHLSDAGETHAPSGHFYILDLSSGSWKSCYAAHFPPPIMYISIVAEAYSSATNSANRLIVACAVIRSDSPIRARFVQYAIYRGVLIWAINVCSVGDSAAACPVAVQSLL